MRSLLLLLALWLAGTSAWGVDAKAVQLSDAQTKFLKALLADRTYHSMTLSPDGKRIAAIVLKKYQNQQLFVETNGEYNSGIMLIEIDGMKATLILPTRAVDGGTALRSPTAVSWVADDLMVVDFNNAESDSINLSGERVAKLGAGLAQVIYQQGRASEWVLEYEATLSPELKRVNARTGASKHYDIDLPGKLASWAFDDAGALRAATTIESAIFRDNTRLTNWYRADEHSPWQKVETFAITDDYWLPLHVLPQPDTLMIQSRRGRDTWAIFTYDTKRREQGELLAGHPTEDLFLADKVPRSNFDSVTTRGMKSTRHWFDPRWARAQATADAALAGQVNLVSGNPEGRVLVYSYSDVEPGRWLVLDTVSRTLQLVARRNAEIDPAQLRPMQTLDYSARDGMTIHAYLTLPAVSDGVKLPLVVLIHGGPNARDHWGMDSEVQMLAANGYAVFQPQFRGSNGFGRRYEEAGFRQWGLAMQDDITDGVKSLTERGMIDPARVCIDGASYGGYAAFWGVIKTPELYRCGISFAGVSDLEAQLAGWYDAESSSWIRETDRSRIGDLAMTPQQIDAVSPVKHVDRIKLPMLIAHGTWDRRVPYAQSERIVRTLRDQGNAVEWLSFPREGHGLLNNENQLKYFSGVLAFLDKYIGPSSGVASRAAQGPAAPASAVVAR